MEEKRKDTRIQRPLVLQYAQSTSVPLCWDFTTISNISRGGILFNSNKLFDKNATLKLRFTIPTHPFDCLEVMGEVVESLVSDYKIRIRFINLNEQEIKIIGDYVDYLSSLNKKK